MPVDRPSDPPDLNDYDAIEAAVMETARGRWFLAEHARRIRAAETSRILAAIGCVAEMIRLQHQPAPPVLVDQRFAEMASTVEERLLDLSWFLRGRGVEDSVCELLDREAIRLRRFVQGESDEAPLVPPRAQRDEIVHAAERAPPQHAPVPDLSYPRDELTNPLIAADIAQDAPQPDPVAPAAPPPLRPEALAWIERLPLREKLRLFA